MIEVIVSKSLFEVCPSLLEIEPSMENIGIDEPLEVRWSNAKSELAVLARYTNRKFKLYVPDLQASERAVAALELPLTLDSNLVDNAKIALVNKKLYNWRGFTKELGSTVTKHLVLKLAADEIRKGHKPKLAYVAKDVILDGITPTNADVLLRLRVLRGY